MEQVPEAKSAWPLSIRARLLSGRMPGKAELAAECGVAARSIRRDTESPRYFPADRGLTQDVVFGRTAGGRRPTNAARARLLRAARYHPDKQQIRTRPPWETGSDCAAFGGPEEIRTLDLSDANRTLSQLSYRPEKICGAGHEKSLGSRSSKAFLFPGGDKRDRTADLLNAIQALSQLSYTPISGVPHQNSDYNSKAQRKCQEVFSEILFFLSHREISPGLSLFAGKCATMKPLSALHSGRR